MKPDALIVIDVQEGLVNEHPYHENELIEIIQKLLFTSRSHKVPVIYIQHEEEEEGGLVHGSEAWQIAKSIAPQPGEKIFEKHFNSAFRKTGLHEYLQSIGAQNIVLCGMQAEYCVDVTTKVAFELGYNVRIPVDGTATYDNKLFSASDMVKFFQWYIWHNRYAQVVPLEELIAEIEK